MEKFTEELNELLMRYPALPEFTMTVRPRLSIKITEEPKLSTAPTQNTVSIPQPMPQVTAPMMGEYALPLPDFSSIRNSESLKMS